MKQQTEWSANNLANTTEEIWTPGPEMQRIMPYHQNCSQTSLKSR